MFVDCDAARWVFVDCDAARWVFVDCDAAGAVRFLTTIERRCAGCSTVFALRSALTGFTEADVSALRACERDTCFSACDVARVDFFAAAGFATALAAGFAAALAAGFAAALAAGFAAAFGATTSFLAGVTVLSSRGVVAAAAAS